MTPSENRWYPLPRRTAEIFANLASRTGLHPGLLLDKFAPAVRDEQKGLKREQEHQHEALRAVAEQGGDPALFKAAAHRRRSALELLGATTWESATVGPLTLHLARAGALENAGIALHPVYGFAYLPGSGLKGIARAFAETVWHPDQDDPVSAWSEIERVFGCTPGTAEKRSGRPPDAERPERSHAGTVVFHDAWPTSWPKLLVDIVNNHHEAYYGKKGGEPPGDWENPVPVYFLAIPAGTRFWFALSKRRPTNPEEDLAGAQSWLARGLAVLGGGAKTNAGYGSFRLPEGVADVPLPEAKFARFEGEIELASPGFLAGAEQEASDCDLRPATLRGLLRWWWRTLHAGFLDSNALFELESAVFGDTEHGGPLRIELEPIGSRRQATFARREMAKHPGLPQQGRATLGLDYVTFGMDDLSRGVRRSRQCLDPGARWRVRLTAREWRPAQGAGRKSDPPKKRIAARKILEQAECALWLLCHFGGAGSKSRKGFGSLRLEGLGLSVGECEGRALDFRKLVRGSEGLFDPKRAQSPALEAAHARDFTLNVNDPWVAAHEIGQALKSFSQRLASESRRDDRAVLGLPRRGVRIPRFHTGRRAERHASPLIHHIEPAGDGKMLVRAIAFPSPVLPDLPTSERVLKEILDHEAEHFSMVRSPRPVQPERGSGREKRDRGGARPAPVGRPAAPASSAYEVGDRIRVTLLEDKTNKGKLKAKIEGDPQNRQTYIDNSEDLPSDQRAPGSVIEAVVKTVPTRPTDRMALWFPTPEKPYWPGYKAGSGTHRDRDSRRGPPRRGGRR